MGLEAGSVRGDAEELADAGEVGGEVVLGVGGQGFGDDFGEGFGDCGVGGDEGEVGHGFVEVAGVTFGVGGWGVVLEGFREVCVQGEGVRVGPGVWGLGVAGEGVVGDAFPQRHGLADAVGVAREGGVGFVGFWGGGWLSLGVFLGGERACGGGSGQGQAEVTQFQAGGEVVGSVGCLGWVWGVGWDGVQGGGLGGLWVVGCGLWVVGCGNRCRTSGCGWAMVDWHSVKTISVIL